MNRRLQNFLLKYFLIFHALTIFLSTFYGCHIEPNATSTLSLEGLEVNGTPVTNTQEILNFPTTATITLVFSSPIETDKIASMISLSPKGKFESSLEITFSFSTDYKTVIIQTKSNVVLDFNTRYVLTISDNVFSKDKTEKLGKDIIVELLTVSTDSKGLKDFVFKRSNNPFLNEDVSGIISQREIVIIVSSNITDDQIRQLNPTITFTGKTILPENEMPQDFSQPISYTIVAEDNSTVTYTVSVSRENLSKEADILSFSLALNGSTINGNISGSDININNILFGTNLSSVIPTIAISKNASIAPPERTPQDFSDKPLNYVITAQNRAIYNVYRIKVNYAPISLVVLDVNGNEKTNIDVNDFTRTDNLFAVSGIADHSSWKYRIEINGFSTENFFSVSNGLGNIPNPFTEQTWNAINLTQSTNTPLEIKLTLSINTTVPQKEFLFTNISLQ